MPFLLCAFCALCAFCGPFCGLVRRRSQRVARVQSRLHWTINPLPCFLNVIDYLRILSRWVLRVDQRRCTSYKRRSHRGAIPRSI
jgi:hypothetical protein